jgi:hypothetical protein
LRDSDTVSKITISAPVELTQLDRGTCRLHDPYSLRNDFLPDAIPGNNGDTLLGTEV